VRRQDDENGVHIYKGNDVCKDQSYFLATTSREQVERILFPVGHLEKDETRKLAEQFGLSTAGKHESQDICFIPAGDRAAFLKREGSSAGFEPGNIINRNGNVLGKHQGIAHYTLGQRKGLGLSGGPWHVVGLDGNSARVVVAPPEEALIHRVKVDDITWVRKPIHAEVITAKLRYQSKPALCCISAEGESMRVVFDAPQKPTAPGQVAAFYAGNELLGGGIISEVA